MAANIFSSLGRDLGIDIGTTYTRVFVEGRGIVLSEPSVVATDTKQQDIVAVGYDAERMLHRTPESLKAMSPLKDGFIVDYRVTRAMLHYFMSKASLKAMRRSRVLLSVPSGITEVEKRAMTDAILQAGAREAFLIESSTAAAFGAGLPVFDAIGSMVVDIGGGTTDVSVTSLGGVAVARSARIGGNDFDAAVLRYIKDCFSVMVAERTIEEIKMKFGTVLQPEEGEKDEEYSFRARDARTGLVRRIMLHRSEISRVLNEPLRGIVEVIKSVAERMPPELAADISERGFSLTGGSAYLGGLGAVLSKEIGVPVRIPQDPETAVVNGLGIALQEFPRLDRFILAEKKRNI